MGTTEYVLLALVILVPLAIAVAVTLWSLEQVRYRPKRRRPRPPLNAAGDESTSMAAGAASETTAATDRAVAP